MRTEITATDVLDGDTLSWERCVYHTAPRTPYSVDDAHMIMQEYRGCLRHQCARKQAAWDVLVAAGRILPDAGRTR